MSSQTVNKFANSTISYTVKRGDCLWNISKNFYKTGTKWPLIYETNRDVIGKNADLIIIGTRLSIPNFQCIQNNQANQQSNGNDQKSKLVKPDKTGFSVVPVANAFKQAAYLLHPTTTFKVDHKIMPPIILQNLNCTIELSLTLKGDVTIGKEGALHGITFDMNKLQGSYSNVYNQFLGYYKLKPSVSNDGVSLDITTPAGQTSKMKVDMNLNPSISQCYASEVTSIRIGEFNVSYNIGYCIDLKSNCRDLSELLIPVPAYDTVPVYTRNKNPNFSDSTNFTPAFFPNNALSSFTSPASNNSFAQMAVIGTVAAGIAIAGGMIASAPVAVPFAAAVLLIPVLRTQFNTSSLNSL